MSSISHSPRRQAPLWHSEFFKQNVFPNRPVSVKTVSLRVVLDDTHFQKTLGRSRTFPFTHVTRPEENRPAEIRG